MLSEHASAAGRPRSSLVHHRPTGARGFREFIRSNQSPTNWLFGAREVTGKALTACYRRSSAVWRSRPRSPARRAWASPRRRARCRESRLWMPRPPTEPASWSGLKAPRFLVVSVVAFGFSLLVLSSFVRISLPRTGSSELVRPGAGAHHPSLTATFELFVGNSAV